MFNPLNCSVTENQHLTQLEGSLPITVIKFEFITLNLEHFPINKYYTLEMKHKNKSFLFPIQSNLGPVLFARNR